MIKAIICIYKGHQYERTTKDVVRYFRDGQTGVMLNRPFMKCKRCQKYREI